MTRISFYDHLTTHVVPGPRSLSYFVPLLLLPIALLIPRNVSSRWQSATIFLPILAAATVHCWVHMGGVDVISVDVLLCSCYFLWFRDVHEDFVYVVERREDAANGSIVRSNGNPNVDSRPPGTEVVEERYPSTFLNRVRWVGILLVSIRLHNWRIGDISHDRRQPPLPSGMSRTAFVRLTIISFVRGYLILDLTRAYISYDPYFKDPTVSVSSPLPFATLGLIPPRLLRSGIIGAQAWAAISQMMYLPCLLPLGFNALGFLPDEWSPHVWPRLFGSWSEISRTGVRGFWGVYWHQTMRVMTTGPGIALADTLKLERRSMLRYAAVTACAFLLSGTTHMGLVPPKPLHAIESIAMIRFRILAFFSLQPLVILVEMVLGRWTTAHLPPSFRYSRLGTACRHVGNVVFFVVWSAMCLPLLGDMARQIGYWRVWPVPMSLWRGVRGESWLA